MEEVAIGEWMRRGEVHRTSKDRRRNEELDGADKVNLVDPGDELIAGADSAPEAMANETEEDVEDAARIGAEGHCTAQRHLTGPRSWG